MKKTDKGNDMQITLNQLEIETAVRRYINEQVNIQEGYNVTINFNTSEGEKDFSVSSLSVVIDLVPSIDKTPRVIPTRNTPKKVEAEPKTNEIPAETLDGAKDPVEAKEEETATPTVEPEVKPKSLFGHLSKPKNV